MKICLLEPYFLRASPAGSQMLWLALELSKRHDITVVAADIDERLAPHVHWHKLPQPLRMPGALSYWSWRRAYNRFLSTDNAQEFDVVHSSSITYGVVDVVSMHFCAAAARKSCWSAIAPTFKQGLHLWFRYHLYFRWKIRFGEFLERWMFRKAQPKCWVAVSQGLASELTNIYGKSSISVINNAFPYQFSERAEKTERIKIRAQFHFADSDVVCVMCGLGDWTRKGLFLMFEALRELPLNVKLLVVGGGKMEPLAEFCRNTDLKERVMFAGFTEHPEQYYIASDVFVFPSYYEAFPLVPMEAAAAGLPIVATRVNGVREWIEDGKTGLLSSFEPTDFAEKILFLANDINARYRFGAAARQAVSEFTVRRMTDSYETLYKSISPTLSDLAKIDKAQNE